MANGNKYTKNEHFVPQVYLRGFSRDKKTLYLYDVCNNQTFPNPIPIKSILFEKNLYELKNSNDELVYHNYVEKHLKKFEDMYSRYLHKLEMKAFIPDNYNCGNFMDSEEKAFWIAYTTIQLLRLPEVIRAAKSFTREYFTEQIGVNDLENMALAYCMPFFEKIDDNTQSAFNSFMKPIFNMKIVVGVLEGKDVLMTSDFPVYVESSEYNDNEFRKVIFPLSSKLCLLFWGKEEKAYYKQNSLIPITQDLYNDIIDAISYRCTRFVVSEKKITIKDINRIRNAKFEMDNFFLAPNVLISEK